jgi:3-oxocholest-4-en-26-oyl-CoA dehydrogenase alpha subunit
VQPDLAPELAAWREEVRGFLDDHLPATHLFDHEFTMSEADWAFALDFSKKVAQKGWIALTWPEADGGMGRSRLEHLVMMEEFFYREAPLVNFIGWGLAAGTLLIGGDREQRRRLLPPIARSEVLWAEGLSEPDAGSDLAALTTRAERDGADWILNGCKTYMTWGHVAHVAYVAARTSPGERRHEGISAFRVDLQAPGVTLTPLLNLGGGRQNVVYFDDVRLSTDDLLGQEGQAWNYVMSAFYASGGTHSTHSRFNRLYDEIVSFCRTTDHGRALIADPVVQAKVVELGVIAHTQRLLAYEMVRRQDLGRPPTYSGALVPVSSKEAMPRFAQLCMEVVGPLAQLTEADEGAPLRGMIETNYRRSFANHAGGTPQVKRMVLATRGLGLPR